MSWFVGLAILYVIPKFFTKKWTYREVRNKVRFSKTMWLNTYADSIGWKKDHQTWLQKLKAKFQ